MKKIRKLTIGIVSTLVVTLVFGQGVNAQEKIINDYGNPSFNSSGPSDSHEQFAGQALEILKNDKGEDESIFYNEYKTVLLNYCDMPDKDENAYAYAYHFYNPYTHRNYLLSCLSASKKTAMTKFMEHIKNAVNSYSSNKEQSMQQLGRAVHFLEDVNVPHHAANLLGGVTSHTQYEGYISNNNSKFFVTTSNAYDKYSDMSFDDYCTSIFDECAKNAYSYKETAKSYKEEDWDKVAYPTIKLAQENIASLLYRFSKEVSK